jgi:hypothetical protein
MSQPRPRCPKVTKKEAVRRSLAKHGQDAKPAAIQVDIQALKGLVERVRADHLEALIDLLAR